MQKGKIVVVLAVAALLVAFVVPGDRLFEVTRSLDVFSSLFREVTINYVDEPDPDKLSKTAIDAMLESLDPYTVYIPKEESEAFDMITTGQYAGIGASVIELENKVMVSQPYSGFPAAGAGIRVGDEFVGVNGITVKGSGTERVTSLLKGAPGTSVDVELRRAGSAQTIRMKLVRQRIKVPNVSFSGMMDSKTGLIRLSDFTPGAAKEVQTAWQALSRQGACQLVLDLRENPGGILNEAVNVVNLFIPKGREVVRTKGQQKENDRVYRTLNQPMDVNIPMVVLVSSGSASASEIVAGALQDYDRALLVGQRTFGKGLVQTTRMLSNGAQLKMTTARYYIPSGRCIQELDYARRNEDGSASVKADSLRQTFRTSAGRKVYDGGGLMPDVEVEAAIPEGLVESLLSGGYLFLYAREYRATHPQPADFRGFTVEQATYDHFVRWSQEKGFWLQSPMEAGLFDLEKAVRQEYSDQRLNAALEAVKETVRREHAAVLSRYQSDVKAWLEEEIAFHYGLEQARMQASLDSDHEIVMAVKWLADPGQIKKMLSGHGAIVKP